MRYAHLCACRFLWHGRTSHARPIQYFCIHATSHRTHIHFIIVIAFARGVRNKRAYYCTLVAYSHTKHMRANTIIKKCVWSWNVCCKRAAAHIRVQIKKTSSRRFLFESIVTKKKFTYLLVCVCAVLCAETTALLCALYFIYGRCRNRLTQFNCIKIERGSCAPPCGEFSVYLLLSCDRCIFLFLLFTSCGSSTTTTTRAMLFIRRSTQWWNITLYLTLYLSSYSVTYIGNKVIYAQCAYGLLI